MNYQNQPHSPTSLPIHHSFQPQQTTKTNNKDNQIKPASSYSIQKAESTTIEANSRRDLFQALKMPLLATFVACFVLFLITTSQSKSQIPLVNKTYYHKQKNHDTAKVQQLNNLLNISRYYDLNHFNEGQQIRNIPRIINEGTYKLTAQLQEPRKQLKMAHNFQQVQQIISMMKYPSTRPQKLAMDENYLFKNADKIDLSFFFYELSKQPNNPNYLQAEFYRYDKLYDIGYYGSQLPICTVLVGRNNKNNVKKLYDSISRQNYSNYRVVHVDDNSDDQTTEYIKFYLKNQPHLQQRVTLITQPYRKNALYNRNYGVMNYCQEGDIVVDIDADDWLIGNQVFQLVNSIYQAGIFYKGRREQIWAAYMSHITCCPNARIFGIVAAQLIQKQAYRSEGQWRTTQLRTYLWKLYKKVDKQDFIDPLMIKRGEFFVQSHDSFIHNAIFELAAPKHIKFLDEFPYFYTGSPNKQNYIEVYYSVAVAKNQSPYKPLQTLNQSAMRHHQFKVNQRVAHELKQRKSEMFLKRQALKAKVQQLIEGIDTQKRKPIQQLTVLKSMNNGKSFGVSSKFKVNISHLKSQNTKTNFDYGVHGIKNNIQIGSEYDYMNLGKIIDFYQLEQSLFHQFPHQILTFNYNKSLNATSGLFSYKYFKNQGEIVKYIDRLVITNPKGQQVKDFQYYLGSHLAMPFLDQTTLQMQYYYVNKKYNISQNKEEKPICIFVYAYNIFSQGRYRNFFHSVERMNYTNYKVIWVDDFSSDSSAHQVYNYLQKSKMKLKNKIKIIKNNQHVGYLGSIRMHVKRYCDHNDIVVVCNGEDNLVGTQHFQILNTVYDNSDYWFVFSRYLVGTDAIDQFNIGNTTVDTKIQLKQIRTNLQQFQLSPMKSFRRKVLDAIPLEHFIEYRIDKDENSVFPRYYISPAAGVCLIYSIFEAVGNKRIFFILDFMYKDDNIPKEDSCHQRQQIVEEYKCKLKTPLQTLLDERSVARMVSNYEVNDKILQTIHDIYPSYEQCLRKMEWL